MVTINFQEYLCVDPSFFTSVKRLESLSILLNSLKHPDSKIVLPSELKPLFPSQTDFNEIISPESKIIELLKKWNSNLNSKNKSELQSLEQKSINFFQSFQPIFADELITNSEKIGPQSIHLSDVVDKLGDLVGKTIFELMAVSYEKHGVILAYGRKPITMIRKISTPALEGYSSMKHNLIVSGNAPKTLKIIGIFFDALAANDFSEHFDILGMPVPLNDIGPLGLAIIADG
jgi:hypothetical protein